MNNFFIIVFASLTVVIILSLYMVKIVQEELLDTLKESDPPWIRKRRGQEKDRRIPLYVPKYEEPPDEEEEEEEEEARRGTTYISGGNIPSSNIPEGKMFKFTRSQLKKIIREEVLNVIRESGDRGWKSRERNAGLVPGDEDQAGSTGEADPISDDELVWYVTKAAEWIGEMKANNLSPEEIEARFFEDRKKLNRFSPAAMFAYIGRSDEELDQNRELIYKKAIRAIGER